MDIEKQILQLNTQKSSLEIIKILKKIGRIEDNFPVDPFMNLLSSTNSEVRRLSIYNLGKLKFKTTPLKTMFYKEKDSLVKREIISSIGRQKNKENIDFFIKTLKEKDPKIVLQSIRSLLYFKNVTKVNRELKKLKKHPNEMIQDVLQIAFSKKSDYNRDNHTVVNDSLSNVVVEGDVLNTLSKIQEESFHLTFTSPPYYNARDYSIYQSYNQYLDFLENVFKEVHRLTKNGRFLIVNTSPVIEPRFSRNHSSKRYPIPFDLNSRLINQGWEFIDDIIWEKPEPSVKNRVGGFFQHRKPLGYKPNSVTEYVMVYRKKTTDLLDWNIKQYDDKIISESKVNDNFETSNLWRIDPVFDKSHSAVFPKQLCENIIRYYSMKGDLVFDPFAGSGTVGEVSFLNNRKFFLTEIQADYIKRIKKRLNKHEGDLFNDDQDFRFFNQEDFLN